MNKVGVNLIDFVHQLKRDLETIWEQIETGLGIVDLPQKKQQKLEMEDEMQAADFWDNPERAQEVSIKVARLTEEINDWEAITQDCKDLVVMFEEIKPEEQPEIAKEYTEMVEQFKSRWEKLNIRTFLNDKFDRCNAIVTVFCGLGGKDAQDFAEMLSRMYLRYAEKNGFNIELVGQSAGDEVGIKQATILIKGEFAYGYLKHEQGVHRLIRLSPFNAGNTRETSFAKIEVIPELTFAEHIEIKAEDLRVDTFRASGAGGQHVNTTDSAVRITHLPTGLVASCQNERSQLQNRERAMQILQGKLQQLMHEQQLETLDKLKGEKTEMAWGHQIRTYTLHPYTLVKDTRSGHEEKNAEAVLDGDLQGFIEAGLEQFGKTKT